MVDYCLEAITRTDACGWREDGTHCHPDQMLGPINTRAPLSVARHHRRMSEEHSAGSNRVPPIDRAALADRRVFRLDDTAWAEFSAILDRPAQRVPKLAMLLRKRAPWDEP